ncbi:hypothetical protein [Cellulomonas sp. S1-8]|uniref:hypothetical protein n=1 Tax=Cellulomonas sp. S1-8 TaxID=2904790 RepID=UPI002242C670|nr:hypothetical protein [Cellulomonas sp. S1-8]UZN02836.1 hypothetical protein OKX07_17555 [Cellulomonas sp. S1-8]
MAAEGVDARPADERGYVYVRLTGERFEAEGMPADAAVELKSLAELLFQLARQTWLDEHPGRQRVPPAFDDLFDLRLVSIGEGSAVPQLVLHVPAGFDPMDDGDDMLPAMHRAPAMLVKALETARDDFTVPATFPSREVGRLARIGKSLGENESIHIGVPRPDAEAAPAPSPIEVTSEVRETLALIDMAFRADPEPEPTVLEGVVTEFDSGEQSFHLRVIGRPGLTRCQLVAGDTTLARAVIDVLAEDGVTAPDVRVQGWAVAVGSGRVKVLHQVTDVEVVRTTEEKALMTRLDELTALTDGWWGPSSRAVVPGVAEATRGVLPGLARLSTPPLIVPQPDGSVVIESEVAGSHLTAAIEEDGTAMFLCVDDPAADQPDELVAAFNAEALVRFLEQGVIDA